MLYGYIYSINLKIKRGLNPYFFGKCSTAFAYCYNLHNFNKVLILIFLENALRPVAHDTN